MTTDNLAQVVYLTKNTTHLRAMQEILSKTNGTISTQHWLSHKEDNALINAPVPETCVPGLDTMDLYASNEARPMEETEDFRLESPHDWIDVVGDHVTDNDDGSLPF
jgi:hypothetical protein